MSLRELQSPLPFAQRLHSAHIGAIVTPRPEMLTGSQRYFFDLLRALPHVGVGAYGAVVGSLPFDELLSRTAVLSDTGTSCWERVRRSRHLLTKLLGLADVVASHFAPHAFPTLDLIRGRRPLVAHFHGPWTFESLLNRSVHPLRLPLLGAEELAVYHSAARIIALFEGYAVVLEHVYRIPRERIRVIPGGVDLERFSPSMSRSEVRMALGLPIDRPIILTVGRLVRGKGFPGFIAAFDRVRRAVPDALLVIGGNGPLEPLLRRMVDHRELRDAVRFVGHVSGSLPLVYRAANCLLTTSYGDDGFGLVVAEANACGTPAVLAPFLRGSSSPHPALTFASDGSSSAIAEVLIEVLRGRRPLPEESACVAFARRYGWLRIARAVRAVYEESLQ